jgi:hypothetical protein
MLEKVTLEAVGVEALDGGMSMRDDGFRDPGTRTGPSLVQQRKIGNGEKGDTGIIVVRILFPREWVLEV